VHTGYRRYRPEMLALGVNLYELSPQKVSRSLRLGRFSTSIGRLHVKGTAVDRRWLLVGSVNLDGRSAVLNTELTINIDCPPLVDDALSALGREPWRTMYRVTLAEDGKALQWRDIGEDGRIEIFNSEPGDSAWQRGVHWFQSLFVDEVML